jgi:hypothetical protein
MSWDKDDDGNRELVVEGNDDAFTEAFINKAATELEVEAEGSKYV